MKHKEAEEKRGRQRNVLGRGVVLNRREGGGVTPGFGSRLWRGLGGGRGGVINWKCSQCKKNC